MTQANINWGGIDTADVTTAGNRLPYFLEGRYKVRIDTCKAIVSRNGIAFFVVEATILESNNPERPAGSRCSWLQKIQTDMGPVNIKKFVGAANGLDPASEEVNREVNQDVVEYVVSDDQPLAGTVMPLQCVLTETKAGNPFTIHNWEPAIDAA